MKPSNAKATDGQQKTQLPKLRFLLPVQAGIPSVALVKEGELRVATRSIVSVNFSNAMRTAMVERRYKNEKTHLVEGVLDRFQSRNSLNDTPHPESMRLWVHPVYYLRCRLPG